MIDRSLYPTLAKNVLNSINVTDGESVYIMGGEHLKELLEEIGVQVIRRGGESYIQYLTDDYSRAYYEESTVGQLKRTPKINRAIAEAMDAWVTLEPFKDPSLRAKYPEKMQARSEGTLPIRKIIYEKPGKKWVYMGWATEEMARMFGVPLEVLEKLVIGGCSIDHHKLKADCERLAEKLKGARYIYITDPYGTDLRLAVKDRVWCTDDGIWSDEKAEAGDKGYNLPAGEVFCAPVETEGEGTLYCTLTVDELTRGTVIKGARLYFKDGRLIPEKCTAEVNESVLKDTIARLLAVDMDKYGAPNALGVAELGIGMNPVIDRPIGYILTDEKIGGSIHVAFGNSEVVGGGVPSSMHWDFVSAPAVTMIAEYEDGSRRTVIKDGKHT
jgi:aminopeptidase